MARLNQERQKRLEPLRIRVAIEKIEALGYSTTFVTKAKAINFKFKGSQVAYYPYSGWASGLSIKDGRGLQNLLNQLKPQS